MERRECEDWLAVWEPIEAPGRHSRMYPAGFAVGYRYRPEARRDRVPHQAGPVPTMWDRVIRAIPVDGVVTDVPPSWSRSPQVRQWMDKPKVNWTARLRRWLKGACA